MTWKSEALKGGRDEQTVAIIIIFEVVALGEVT
jgi:hypothetical protein